MSADLKAAAQQALDWLYDNDILHPTKVSEDLRAALAQQAEPVQQVKTCAWRDNFDAIYETECGNLHIIDDGSPEDNGMRYCCYCGKELKHEPRAD